MNTKKLYNININAKMDRGGYIRMRSKKLKLIILCIGLAVVVAGTSYSVYRYKKSKSVASSQVKTQEQKVTKQSIKLTTATDGTISLPLTYLEFDVGGKIKSIPVKQGQKVKTGDILATLDSTDYQRAYDKAQRAYDKAVTAVQTAEQNAVINTATDKQNLNELEQKYNSAQTKVDTQIATESQKLSSLKVKLDTAKAEYEPMIEAPDAYTRDDMENKRVAYEEAKVNYENQVINLQQTTKSVKDDANNALNNYNIAKQSYETKIESYQTAITTAKYAADDAKQALDNAKEDLDNTVLRASCDGEIVSVNNDEGDTVSSSATNSSNKTTTTTSATGTTSTKSTSSSVFSILPDKKIEVSCYVLESDMKNIKVGQKVEITVDAVSSEPFVGDIKQINNVAKVDSNSVVSYQVICEFDNTSNKVLNSMTADVNIIYDEKSNVLCVSNKAVSSDSGKQYVNVKGKSGQVEKREVTTGISDGDKVEITSGLSEGETVILGSGK
jgi:multidrug efflux pump subunit AcrA (membrane-fusion protein)